MLGPRDDRVVKFEPGHPKDDRKVAETGGIELNDLGMRTDVELEWERLLGDGAGRNGTAVDDCQVSRRGLGLETDGVGESEVGVDKRQRRAAIDQRESWDWDAVDGKGDGKDDVFLRVKARSR